MRQFRRDNQGSFTARLPHMVSIIACLHWFLIRLTHCSPLPTPTATIAPSVVEVEVVSAVVLMQVVVVEQSLQKNQVAALSSKRMNVLPGGCQWGRKALADLCHSITRHHLHCPPLLTHSHDLSVNAFYSTMVV